MDFTLEIYKSLLLRLQSREHKFIPINEYLNSSNLVASQKTIRLRHDVDLLPKNALEMARLEFENGIRGTYYFRIVPESFDVAVIEKIAELGHEIGYHYEDVDLSCKEHGAWGMG
jgi:hypothetical protein